MRAIIRCKSNVELNELDGLLTEKGWWPNISQDHEEVVRRKENILSHVASEDVVMVRETYQYTIYDDTTKSWGIISAPARRLINFRLRNPDSDRLKAACEKLVTDLQGSNMSRKRGDIDISFTFVSKIEVLEPNSMDHAYSGEVLPARRIAYVLRKKRPEFWVGVLAGLSALIFLVLTIPPIAQLAYGSLSQDWIKFTNGFFDRLATSAIVTATVSILNVILYWIDLRRKPIIIWNV